MKVSEPSNVLKRALYMVPGLRSTLRKAKMFVTKFALKARYKAYKKDLLDDWYYLNWERSKPNYWKLSSELIFYYHKLEKGLCLPPESHRWFGVKPAKRTIELLLEWEDNNYSVDAPIYQAACAVLFAYNQFAKKNSINGNGAEIVSLIDSFLESRSFESKYVTPIPFISPPAESFEVLKKLSLSRRSTRNFKSVVVNLELIRKAIEIAQLSPSACNRQPWRIHIFDKRNEIDELLSLQNGNSGFGGKVPMLAVLCGELGSFFDTTERFEPHLDGGLFLMSFLLALQSLGLSSCCLNWCVNPENDIAAHTIGDIPSSEKILTFLAIGYQEEGTIVPLSARRPLDDVLVKH